jgi:polysaccharide biosynthesis protein PslH
VVLTVSEQDRQALRAIAGEATAIEIVPISVDAQNLAPMFATRRPQRNRLLSIGTMFWPPNSEGVMWWLREGYEYLRSECIDVIYDIVGARPPRALQRLANRHPGVRLHGYVADALPFWKETSALAVPLLSGGGVRVKILEAMAMGVPVISTTMGCEGLDVRSGEHLLVADTPQAFASACVSVLQDEDLAHLLTENARQLILEHYDKEVALQALDSVYERIGASV